MTNLDVEELFERYVAIENEIKQLQEDRKSILAEYKDRVDPKAFKTALAAVKAKAKLKPNEANEYDQVSLVLEKKLCIEHID